MKFKEIKSKLKNTKYYYAFKSLKDKSFLFTSLSKLKNKLTFDTSTDLNIKKQKRIKLIKLFGMIPRSSNIINLSEINKIKNNIKIDSIISKQLSNNFIKKIKLKSSIKNFYSSKINSLKNNSSLFLNKLRSYENKSLKSKGKKRSKSLQKKSFKYFSFIFKNSYLETLKVFYKRYIPKDKSPTKDLPKDYFLVIQYADHILTVSKVLSNNKLNKIDQIININMPTAIVGDYKVENPLELQNILQDIIELFEMVGKPIILLLSSGFFSINSFDDAELVVFSENNPQLLSKSPFLPDDTLIQYSRVSGNKLTSFHRVVYVNKTILDSWIVLLSI